LALSAESPAHVQRLDFTYHAGRPDQHPLVLVSIAHTADAVVPLQDSRDLLGVANEPKQLLEVPGADRVFWMGAPRSWRKPR